MEGIRGSPSGGEDFGMEVSKVEVAPEGVVRKATSTVEVKPTSETVLPPVVESSGPVAESRRPPRVIRTYSKKPAGVMTSETKELGTVPTVVAPQRRVFLKVSEPAPPHPPSSLSVLSSPLPSGGDHSSDEDYLEERPLQIWVNATRSRRKLRLDRQRLDDGALRERPVRPADTALGRVVNLMAYARGQAPRFTRGLGSQASDILFVSQSSQFPRMS